MDETFKKRVFRIESSCFNLEIKVNEGGNLLRISHAIVLFCLTFVLATGLVNAKEIAYSKAKKQGFSEKRLERLTQFMNAKVSDGTMVGGFGLIARNGKIVYEQDYGFASREAKTKINKDTIFRIYSMTKPIVSVALMMLYEEGKFLLDDPIATYIPELSNLRVAMSTASFKSQSGGVSSRTTGKPKTSLIGKTRIAKRQPTIRDLLRHTAGFTYGLFGTTEVDELYLESNLLNASTMNSFVKKLGKLPLQYDPGSQWHYSVAVDVQGYLIEVLSGKKLGVFLNERIFGPLDMKDTFFVIPSDKKSRLAELYQPVKSDLEEGLLSRTAQKGLELADPNVSTRFYDSSLPQMGGGGLLSSTRDYLRFCQMILNGGVLDGKRILSPKTITLMTSNQLKDTFTFYNEEMGFGLGFGIITNLATATRAASLGNYFWGGAAGTLFWIDPHEKMIGIFMVQSLPHRTQLGSYFQNLSYQALVNSKLAK